MRKLLYLTVILTLIISGCTQNNTYQITFNSNGGSLVEAISLDEIQNITMPIDPFKEGFSFDGWYLDDVTFSQPFTLESLLGREISNNVDVYAKWSLNTYTITFDTVLGSTITPLSFRFNETISMPSQPNRLGFAFKGWDQEMNGVMPANDITLKAIWEMYDYTSDETYKAAISNVVSMNPLSIMTNDATNLSNLLKGSWYGYDFDWAKAVYEGVANSFYDFSNIRNGQFSINALEYNYVLDGMLASFPIDATTGQSFARNRFPLDDGQYLDLALSSNQRSNRFIYTLKPGLFFEDGTPINADVVLYTLKQYIDPVQNNARQNVLTGSGFMNVVGAYEYFMQGKEVPFGHPLFVNSESKVLFPTVDFSTVGIRKIDNLSFEITSLAPMSQLEAIEHINQLYLVHPERYESGFQDDVKSYTNYGTFDNPLVSYGPYVLKNWEDSKELVFNKNFLYLNADAHNIKSYRFFVNEDYDSIVNHFNEGNLNVLKVSESNFKTFIDTSSVYKIPANSAFRLAISLVRNARYVSGETVLLDPENPTSGSPLVQELAFRRALYFAINRLEFAEEVFPPAIPNVGIVSSIHKVTMEAKEFYQQSNEYLAMTEALGIRVENNGFDPVKAKELFDEAYNNLVTKGVINEGDIVDIDYTYGASLAGDTIAAWIKDMLESVFNGDGPKRINVVTRPLDPEFGGAFSVARAHGDFDLMLTGISGSVNDAPFLSGFAYNNYVGSLLAGKGHNPGDTEIEVRLVNVFNFVSAKEDFERTLDEIAVLSLLDSNGIFKGTFHEAYEFYVNTSVFDLQYPGKTKDLNNLTVAFEFVVLSQGINVPLFSRVEAFAYNDVHIDVPEWHPFLSFGGSRYRWLTSDPDFQNEPLS